MSLKPFKKAYRAIFPSRSEAGMNALFGGQSLGWIMLPKKPGFIDGKIFEQVTISLPWFTYSAISQLLRWNLKEQVVVEYGSGSSTKFFFEQGAKSIYSHEDNPEWFELVRSSLPTSDKLIYKLSKDKNDYILPPSALSKIKPSIILIDGSYRADCVEAVNEYIKDLGILYSPALIILDNSDWHGKSYSTLASLVDYFPIDYYGHGPYNTYTWCTTFFVNLSSLSAESLFSSSRKPPLPMMNGLPNNHSMNI